MKLYRWQRECLQAWEVHRFRGIAHVVTGAGKTFLALKAMDSYLSRWPKAKIRIVVPTVPLARQWQLALLHHVGTPELRPGFFGGGVRDSEERQVMIYIINSARDALSDHIRRDFALGYHTLLICDECHHYQSPQNRRIFDFMTTPPDPGDLYAALGLSATPFGSSDDDILLHALGPEIYRYDVNAAAQDSIISPFTVCETSVSFLPSELKLYRQLSYELLVLMQKLFKAFPELKGVSRTAFLRAVGKMAREANMDPDSPAAAFLLKTWERKEVSVLAQARILCCQTLVESLPDSERILIFCERISQAEEMTRALRRQYGNKCGIYHSEMSREARQRNMSDFRENRTRILVSCRCLDEGIDVPDASVGIVLSGAAVTRQRIQRLGRILRRSEGKESACLYYLYIQESFEDSAFLPGLQAGESFTLYYRSQDRVFENDLYVYAAAELMRKCRDEGYTAPQLRELRRCLMEGLCRADCLLPEDAIARHIKNAGSSVHERNYWQTMRKLSGIVRRR